MNHDDAGDKKLKIIYLRHLSIFYTFRNFNLLRGVLIEGDL